MPPSGEANGRAWVDGCAGPRAHSWRLSGAGARVLPPTAPSSLTSKARPPSVDFDQFCKVKRLKTTACSRSVCDPASFIPASAATSERRATCRPCLTVTLQNFRSIPRADLSYIACICRNGPKAVIEMQQDGSSKAPVAQQYVLLAVLLSQTALRSPSSYGSRSSYGPGTGANPLGSKCAASSRSYEFESSRRTARLEPILLYLASTHDR